MKKIVTLCSLVLSFGLVMGCSDSESDSLEGQKCSKKGTIRCKSPDTPSLAYWCDNGKWKEINLAAVDDKEDVCVVINGKDVDKPECPANTEGSHATVLPTYDPTCAIAECVKDSRGVLYTKEYSFYCKNGGGEVSGNTCNCETGSNSDSDLAGKTCDDKKDKLKCKSPDTPSIAYECYSGTWSEFDYSLVADIEPDVCVVINGKATLKHVCPAKTVGTHATLLPHYNPVCAVAECEKDFRGVLYTREYSFYCEPGGGTVSGNTCDCE